MLPKHCLIKQHIFLLHQFLAVGTITLQRLFLKIVSQCGNSKQTHSLRALITAFAYSLPLLCISKRIN